MDRRRDPTRDWPDWTHRTTDKALQARGWVKVRGHGAEWTAVITDLGRRVLAGDAPPTSVPVHRSSSARGRGQAEGLRRRADGVTVDPVAFINELVEAPNQVLRIPEPDAATRAGYRRGLAEVPADLLPPGKRVTHTGRDWGDLVIQVVAQADPVPMGPDVPVPEVADPENPVGPCRPRPARPPGCPQHPEPVGTATGCGAGPV